MKDTRNNLIAEISEELCQVADINEIEKITDILYKHLNNYEI